MYANVKRLLQSAERTNCVRLSSLALRPLHFRPVVRALQFQTSLKELELPGNVECSCSIRLKQFLSFKEKSQLLSIFILWTVFFVFRFFRSFILLWSIEVCFIFFSFPQGDNNIRKCLRLQLSRPCLGHCVGHCSKYLGLGLCNIVLLTFSAI